VRFYEILPMRAFEQNVGGACTELPCLSWSEYCRWTILLRGCYPLSPEEQQELHGYPTVRFETFDYPYDLYKTSNRVYLCSERLQSMLGQQGLASLFLLIPVQLRLHRTESPWVTYFAVRFGAASCVPCLKPHPIYRIDTPDWIFGYTVYKRRDSLLIVDKDLVSNRYLFVVSNEREYPLVVREDVLEVWLDAGVVVEFQDVLLE